MGHDLSSLQAVVTMEGDNKMVTSFKGMKSVTELNGDTITNVSQHSGLAIPQLVGNGDVKSEGQLYDISHSPSFPPRDLDFSQCLLPLKGIHYVPWS